jgi:hypothetical protein
LFQWGLRWVLFCNNREIELKIRMLKSISTTFETWKCLGI